MLDILDRIDPYLTSQDAPAREFALYAIRSFPAFKAEWPKRLIRAAIDDQDNAVSYLVPLENRVLGENELSLLVDALHIKELKYPHLFLKALREVPLEMKIAHRKKISTLLPDEEWNFLLDLTGAGKEELNAMLQKILDTLEKDAYNHVLYARAKQIAHRQVVLGFEKAAELRRQITSVPADQWLNFNEIISIYKLGLLKDSGSIPELARLFARPEDLMQEELADTLAAFQSDEVVRAVESYARSEDATFPITVIAKTHSPLAVATLKGLYADSNDADNQSFIIQGLAEQLAPDGRPEIEDFMGQKKLPAVLNNEEMAYGYFKVLELDHPDLERWKQIVHEHHKHMLNLRDEPFDAAFERFLKSATAKTQAVSDKVGRNDPCPCGSGKKYKKCHGK